MQEQQHRTGSGNRWQSFGHAFRGLALLFRSEINARIHLLAASMAVALGIYFGLSQLEWVAVVLAIGLVLSAEALNTALEYLCNKVSPEYDPLIGKAKDIAAAAVLLCAGTAAIVGALVFWPYLRSALG